MYMCMFKLMQFGRMIEMREKKEEKKGYGNEEIGYMCFLPFK